MINEEEKMIWLLFTVNKVILTKYALKIINAK